MLRYRSAITLGFWLVELNANVNIIVGSISTDTVIRMSLFYVDTNKMAVLLVTFIYVVQAPRLVTKRSSRVRSENNRHRFSAGGWQLKHLAGS